MSYRELPKPEQGDTSADKKPAIHIYPLNSQSYETCVLSPSRGLVTLVLLVDNTTKQGEELAKAYGRILSRHHYGNLRLLFACYHKHWRWFLDLLNQCPEIVHNEAAWRVKGCVSGGVATAVLLFGAKKQLALFPEQFDVVWELCREEEGEGREGEGTARWKQGEGSPGGGVEGTNCTKRDVGGVLGSVFGYESSSEDSGDNSAPDQQFADGKEQVHERLVQPGRRCSAGCPAGLVEQVDTSFENWCERMGDGSLRRCGVEVWPEWTRS